ncbi:hypothetical protein Acr_14g0006210 [Actinidia rufa]|uniref:Uncharacterized protein n=1 Tax=Actinidia rufa TaxID=165716 RepID=A0A7J0FQJ1_9ERIC|nr:hypothetical protein Acr_14g0006210 [Actinidia rufa]
MEREGKCREREGRKQEFTGRIKLKSRVLVGKRGGNCRTPSLTWRLGFVQADGSVKEDLIFSTVATAATLSARKLGANLWEVLPHRLKAVKMTNGGARAPYYHHRRHNHKDKGFEPPDDSPHEETSEKANLMASQRNNRFGSQETRRKTPYTTKTLGGRGAKLLDDAQRTARAISRKNLDSKSVILSKQRGSPNRADLGVDLHEMLNAKQNREGDLRAKLNDRRAAASSKVITPVGLIAFMTRPEHRETVPRYQTPFFREIEEMDPLEKFTPPRFMVYVESQTQDPISRIERVRQTTRGVNRELPSLTESFIAWFVTNTKAPKGVGSLLMFNKGNNELIRTLCKLRTLYHEFCISILSKNFKELAELYASPELCLVNMSKYT